MLTYEPPENVYGILAAPPCTEFSLVKGSRPRDFEDGMKVVEACLQIIWKSRMDGNMKFWALENPVGFLRQFLGIPRHTIRQWWYGADQDKPTDLWGYYNFPSPTVMEKPPDCKREYRHAARWAAPKCPEEYKGYVSQFTGTARRAAIRAITPPGFAQAFFKANR